MTVTIEFTESVVVGVRPEQAFVLADMARLSEWNPAVRSSELVDGPPMEVGSRYRCRVANGPVRMIATPRLAELVPNERVTYEGDFGPAHSRDTIRFDRIADGTRLTFVNETTMPGWTAPLSGLITKVFHRQARRAVAGAVSHLR